jgi:hypothetical protein
MQYLQTPGVLSAEPLKRAASRTTKALHFRWRRDDVAKAALQTNRLPHASP